MAGLLIGSDAVPALGWQRLEDQTLTGVSDVTMGSSSLITTAYRAYMCIGTNVDVADDVGIHARFTQGGSVVDSSVYRQVTVRRASNSSSENSAGGTEVAFLYAGGYDNGNESYQSSGFRFYLPNPTSTAHSKVMTWISFNADSGNDMVELQGSGMMVTASDTAVSGVYIYPTSSSTMSGKFCLYGLN